MVRTPRRLLPLAAALLAAACGSASPRTTPSTSAPASRIPDNPSQAVRHALSALSQHAFDVTFREDARLHLAGGASSARTRALEAELRGAALSETGVVQFTASTRSGASSRAPV